MPDKLINYKEAFAFLDEELSKKNKPIYTGSFWEFIRDIWAQSYPKPDLFKAWHVGLVANDVERAIQDKKFYCAVLPRYHLKSSLLGHGFAVWSFLRSGGQRFDASGLYLSYSDNMSVYHIAEIKKAIRRNPQLQEWMKDKVSNSDFSFRYVIGGTNADLMHGGLFSFKRGLHVNRFLIADDLLRDPERPLDTAQLTKAEDHFMTESIHIPVGDAMVIVLGTPMMPNDLLEKLRTDERFIYRSLPVFDPVPGRRVLCPEIRTEEQLLLEQRMRPHSFASEFMLMPYTLTNSYFTDEDVRGIEDSNLRSLDPYVRHDLDSDYTVAGFDVGKKRHPSHIAIFTTKNGKMTQVYQDFLEGQDYTTQKNFLNLLVENFDIDEGYIDNTRGELEDRGLSPVWKMLVFSRKEKRQMAQGLEEKVTQKLISLIPNERQKLQIISVNNNFDAASTSQGHGDAFFSICMAVKAVRRMEKGRTSLIGNLNSEYNGIPDVSDNTVCPQCHQKIGWIPERQKCIICYYKKIEESERANFIHPSQLDPVAKIFNQEGGRFSGDSR